MKSRTLAAGLALLGVVPLPGIHRFYLGQSRWGLVYLLLAWKTPLSRIASGIEAIWYLFLDDDEFNQAFNLPETLTASPNATAAIAAPGSSRLDSASSSAIGSAIESAIDPARVERITNAVRDLEQLRQEGLMTESEFEQKRRKLLDQIDG